MRPRARLATPSGKRKVGLSLTILATGTICGSAKATTPMVVPHPSQATDAPVRAPGESCSPFAARAKTAKTAITATEESIGARAGSRKRLWAWRMPVSTTERP